MSIQKFSVANNISRNTSRSGFFIIEFVCALTLCAALATIAALWHSAIISCEQSVAHNLAAISLIQQVAADCITQRISTGIYHTDGWHITVEHLSTPLITEKIFMITLAHSTSPHKCVMQTIGHVA